MSSPLVEAFKQKQPDGPLAETVAAEGLPALADYSPEPHRQGYAFRTDILVKEVAMNKIVRWSRTASRGRGTWTQTCSALSLLSRRNDRASH